MPPTHQLRAPQTGRMEPWFVPMLGRIRPKAQLGAWWGPWEAGGCPEPCRGAQLRRLHPHRAGWEPPANILRTLGKSLIAGEGRRRGREQVGLRALLPPRGQQPQPRPRASVSPPVQDPLGHGRFPGAQLSHSRVCFDERLEQGGFHLPGQPLPEPGPKFNRAHEERAAQGAPCPRRLQELAVPRCGAGRPRHGAEAAQAWHEGPQRLGGTQEDTCHPPPGDAPGWKGLVQAAPGHLPSPVCRQGYN